MNRREFIYLTSLAVSGFLISLFIEPAHALEWKKILRYPLSRGNEISLRDQAYMYTVYFPYGQYAHLLESFKHKGERQMFEILWVRFYKKLKWLFKNFIFIRR